jgi:hypothetical protein
LQYTNPKQPLNNPIKPKFEIQQAHNILREAEGMALEDQGSRFGFLCIDELVSRALKLAWEELLFWMGVPFFTISYSIS